MVDFKEILSQFFISSILGFVTKILSILLCGVLDSHMNHSISNFIGLFVNATLDFFIMRKVFKKEHEESSNFVLKYYIVILLTIVVDQSLYVLAVSYFKKYHKKWYDEKWDKEVFWVRYACGALTYGFFSFPLQKFWVFTTNQSKKDIVIEIK
jgi:putative flippase GtrA